MLQTLSVLSGLSFANKKDANLTLIFGLQGLKSPEEGLCPGPRLDPHYRLALRARRGFERASSLLKSYRRPPLTIDH